MYVHLKLMLTIFIYFFYNSLLSQVTQLNQMDSLWHFKVSATGVYTDGNSSKSLITNKINISKIGKDLGLLSNITYQYGTAGAAKKVVYNDVRAENSLLVYPNYKLFPFVRSYIETNVLRKINFRNEVAIGGIYKVIDKEHQVVNILTGAANQQTNYKTPFFNLIDNNGSSRRNVWKNITGISGRNTIWMDKISIQYKLFWFQSFSKLMDYNYSADTTLEFKISNKFSLIANYFMTFENIEPEQVLPRETQISYGLSYTL
jgi:hypothetical protein